ncbi:SOUL family heme-binding protein [Methylocapsa palsarum]|uniref:SOUL heme-binding protein n=1 Tax=Methylocapsa palsarum TaxID=1612308 RepID=A0A1I4AW26_9HYPH|nr:heme-binding protein [Methylocapsa palsarum]SFK60792.1 SOUL heme-binding protein [Methylocapsa palsarum]
MWWLIGAGVVLLSAALWGPIVSRRAEQPKYKVVAKERDIEIRDYAPMIVAEVEFPGERNVALGQGFRAVADYIFGDNSSSQKVAMTAPVTQQESETIAMTAPVTQHGDGDNWRVRFVMPSHYTLASLPTPNNPAVKLKEFGGRRFAVIRFSGLARDAVLKRHAKDLQDFIVSKNLKFLSAPIYAYYNPPWTLPFLRRNEVSIEIAGEQ